MPDKYSQYLDDDNNVKKMDHFEVLQVNRDTDLSTLKKQMKKLSLEFHPDKNNGEIRAEFCFKRIYEAYEVLSNPKKRKLYENADSVEDYTFSFDFDLPDFESLNEILKMKSEELDELLQRLERLNSPTASISDGLLVPNNIDSLEKIALELQRIYKGTFVTEEVLNKQFKLFSKIKKQAKTSGDFFALYLITQKDPHLNGSEYLQKAAIQGHSIALREVTSKAFSGHLTALEKSLEWALKSLRYLEEIIVPKLEREDPSSETLSELKDNLARLRERRQILPTVIPREPLAFIRLLAEVIEYRKQRGGVAEEEFIIPHDLIDIFENKQQLALALNGGKVKDLEIDKELEVIKKLEIFNDTEIEMVLAKKMPPVLIHSEDGQVINKVLSNEAHTATESKVLLLIKVTLEEKIRDLEQQSKKNKNVITIAIRLNAELTDAINVYISQKSNVALSEEEVVVLKKAFIDSCTKAVNEAKSLLEKELGWGDFLTNLLKSFVNTVISGLNLAGRSLGAKSQFTFFPPAKAPLLYEIDQIEKDVDKTFNLPAVEY